MKKCYLSIDFEDFSHDFKRERGINADGTMREDALLKSYELIEDYCQKKLNGSRITFFTTGILAQKCPAIVEKISKDGHEIACHYYYHDLAYKDSPAQFEKNLNYAIEYLEKASNQKVLGFRAPVFSVRNTDYEHYKVLEKLFVYDSSLNCANQAEVDAFRKASGIQKLILFPVISRKINAVLPAIRTGGTFLKFFPLSAMLKAMNEGDAEGIIPMVYLHPYEFVTDQSFAVPMSEMEGLGLVQKLKWSLRQKQWHVIGNGSVKGKLDVIFNQFESGGPMKTLLSTY